jgi:hypothetical protein
MKSPKFRHRADGYVDVTVGDKTLSVNPTMLLDKNSASLESIIAGEIEETWWGETEG